MGLQLGIKTFSLRQLIEKRLRTLSDHFGNSRVAPSVAPHPSGPPDGAVAQYRAVAERLKRMTLAISNCHRVMSNETTSAKFTQKPQPKTAQ
jgi:hypothetical protein